MKKHFLAILATILMFSTIAPHLVLLLVIKQQLILKKM